MQEAGVALFLYLPGMQGVQIPSFVVAPSKANGLCEEGLWKPVPMGHVVLVMFWHCVGDTWYCPAGHMKTQQMPLMMVLAGAHGGEVLLVVEVVLQPRVVHDCAAIETGKERATGGIAMLYILAAFGGICNAAEVATFML